MTLTHSPTASDTTILAVTNLGTLPVTATLVLPWRVSVSSPRLGWLEVSNAWQYSNSPSAVTIYFDLAPGESKTASTGWVAGLDGAPVQLVLTVDGALVDTLDLELPFTVGVSRRAATPDLDDREVILAPPVG